jgi:predicted alpha-1,2-mannosidase
MKITRRALLGSSGALAIAGAVPAAARSAKAEPNLWIGTGGDGHTYPGATMPFGMVQVSPDTDTENWANCSGYHHGDPTMMGFSHTHLSGTGIADLMDVLVVPGRGAVKLLPGAPDKPGEGYRQTYTQEVAEPGYYAVTLGNGVRSELTAETRVGWQRHHFPAGPGHLLVDLGNYRDSRPGEGPLIDESRIELDTDGTLTGSRRTFRWAKGRRIHFAMHVSPNPDRITLYADTQSVNGAIVTADRVRAVLHYDNAGAAPIVVRTAVSAVDMAGARTNLAASYFREFDVARRQAIRNWADTLKVVKVEGGSDDARVIMTTALYHAMIAPTLFSDVDGRYIGLDREVHSVSTGEQSYSTYSTWDTYRTLHPLLTLVAPDRAKSLVRDLIRQTQQSAYGPPCWPLQGVETGTMIGWHSVAIMAEAAAKGIDADYAAAWPAIRTRAFDPAAPDLVNSRARGTYIERGYLPADVVDESVSRTQEYAYDDWAMAALAQKAGATEDADRLRLRSRNYRNVLDPAIGLARPKLADGSWLTPYDPIQLGHTKRYRDFTEANGWQTTFLNQHDLYGQIAHFGGDAKFAARLDALFAAPSTLPKDAPPDISGLLGQYAHGNEPDQHVPYLYAYVGQPWKTQALVRKLLGTMYRNAPDGIIGNDDCGQMSAWFVMSALGFYPVDPVAAVYVFGSPLFTHAEVRVGKGRKLVVEAPGNRADTPYVAAVQWNGKPWTKSWISHADLAAGGTLRFTMSATPNPAFGAKLADRPPSFGQPAA